MRTRNLFAAIIIIRRSCGIRWRFYLAVSPPPPSPPTCPFHINSLSLYASGVFAHRILCRMGSCWAKWVTRNHHKSKCRTISARSSSSTSQNEGRGRQKRDGKRSEVWQKAGVRMAAGKLFISFLFSVRNNFKILCSTLLLRCQSCNSLRPTWAAELRRPTTQRSVCASSSLSGYGTNTSHRKPKRK